MKAVAEKRVRNGRAAAAPVVRVACYTRKSTEEGLDQEFNSLDAQRQAVESYAASQRANGWKVLPDRYDDGGFTGANLERPAFQRLMEDVKAGRVDLICAYKLDRVSRSLLDFLRVMETLREHDVAFVSVTQSFDTSTPVGRMTLSLLAAFGQFEREMTAERTRDKVHASRRKGIWTGGRIPLGYDLRDKKLVINREEAASVREIYRLHAELGSLVATVQELARRGIRSKTFRNNRGQRVEGGAFDKQSLRRLLRSPIYIGRMSLGTEHYAAAHEPIVETAAWDAAQIALSSKERTSRRPRATLVPVLLRGLLRCGACGSAMAHTYACEGSKRYTYYICSKASKCGAAACPRSRVSAGTLDVFVIERIRAIGCDHGLARETIAAAKAERERRVPELETELARHEGDARRAATDRAKLLAKMPDAGPATRAVFDRVAALEQAEHDAQARAQVAREALTAAKAGDIDEATLRARLREFDGVWDALFPIERARVLALLIDQVTFTGTSGAVEIRFRANGLGSLA